MERIVDSSRITIGRAVGEDVIATTTNDSIDPRNAAVATPPLSSQSIRNLYSIRTSESLSTPFNSNTRSNGNLFQVNAINCVIIRAMHVNNYSNSGTTAAIFTVYKRSGALLPGDTTDSTLWPIGDRTMDVTLLPSDQPSPLPEGAFTAIHMDAGTSVSLHVVRSDGGDIGSTNGIAVGNIAAKDNNIEILEGYGNDYFFKSTRSPQVWNGIIEYDQCSNSPSVSPSGQPSVSPSVTPLPSPSPSVTPSDQPSVSPSVTPLPSDERSSAVKTVGASSFALALTTLFLM